MIRRRESHGDAPPTDSSWQTLVQQSHNEILQSARDLGDYMAHQRELSKWIEATEKTIARGQQLSEQAPDNLRNQIQAQTGYARQGLKDLKRINSTSNTHI
jgi:hypothetical protein